MHGMIRCAPPAPIHQAAMASKKGNSKLNRMRIIVWLRFGGIQSHNNKSNRLYRLIQGNAAAAGKKSQLIFVLFCCMRPTDQLILANKYCESTHYLCCGCWCSCSTAVTAGAMLSTEHRAPCVYISFIPFSTFIYIRYIYFSFISVCSVLVSRCAPARLPSRSAVAGPEFPVEWFGFRLVVNCA